MKKLELTKKMIRKYEKYLIDEEKSTATIEKYMRDITAFYENLPEEKLISKESLLMFKEHLHEKKYKITSINSILVAVNGFLTFVNRPELKLKLHKIQRNVFYNESKELTKLEYRRLLKSAKANGKERLYILLQTICATGIRVSEHRYITVESLCEERAVVHNKGKTRIIFIPKELKKMLLIYCQKNNIKSGAIFITKTGKPLDRSNIWQSMKKLCDLAQVDAKKVFPHNLRHLFALTYYRLKKDIVRLADLLGHSSINTTRIYTMTDGKECQRSLSQMNLVSLLNT